MIARTLILFAAAALSARAEAITYHRDTRRFDLALPSWKGLTAGVKVNRRWIRLSDFPSCAWTPGTLSCEGVPPLKSFQLRFETQAGKPYVVVRAAIEAAASLQLEGFQLATSESGVPFGARDAMIFGEGFNALQIGTLQGARDLREPVTTAWISGVASSGARETLACAALTARLWPTWFEWMPAQGNGGGVALSIRAGGETSGESIRVAANSTVASDAVMIISMNPRLSNLVSRPTEISAPTTANTRPNGTRNASAFGRIARNRINEMQTNA